MTEPDTFIFADDGAIPNSRLPLLVYRAVVPHQAEAIERLFEMNLWPPAWRDGVYPFHHFHSNVHEVLGVARGEAIVLFGGPYGQELEVKAGDVVVVPAGVGHCNQRQSDDLLVIGGYPASSPAPDLHRGRKADHALLTEAVKAVPMPPADPVLGKGGAMHRLWGV